MRAHDDDKHLQVSCVLEIAHTEWHKDRCEGQHEKVIRVHAEDARVLRLGDARDGVDDQEAVRAQAPQQVQHKGYVTQPK